MAARACAGVPTLVRVDRYCVCELMFERGFLSDEELGPLVDFQLWVWWLALLQTSPVICIPSIPFGPFQRLTVIRPPHSHLAVTKGDDHVAFRTVVKRADQNSALIVQLSGTQRENNVS